MKIVINICFGGFGLSHSAIMRYSELSELNLEPSKEKNGIFGYSYKTTDGKDWYSFDIKRDDPLLVQVVNELGDEANDMCSELSVVEIPDDIKWEISEYDGNEHVAECHRTWG